jgi:hypothetical protein
MIIIGTMFIMAVMKIHIQNNLSKHQYNFTQKLF